jgi:sirohydrochlorin ferrochelatase
MAEDRTEELFDQWEAEDANMTAEEIAVEQARWEQIKANLNCRPLGEHRALAARGVDATLAEGYQARRAIVQSIGTDPRHADTVRCTIRRA